MKMRRNLGGLAVSAAVVTLLAACSATPPVEEETNKSPVVAKKVVKKPSKDESLAKKKAIVLLAKKPVTPVVETNKAAKKIQLAKAVVKKPVTVVRKQTVPVARKQVVARAPQSVNRQKQPVKSRAVAVAKKYWPKTNATKVAQPVVRLAARTAPARVVRTSVARTTKPTIRKAIYRKPVTPRKSVQRIDPNRSFGYALSNAAVERTKQRVRYDGRYLKIGYPWGDVPKSIGVCTDVVIRSYRRLGIDLQQEVHKDISKDFYAYPNLTKWGLEKPDPNIDHRRVYNLQAFFKRHKAELPRSRNPRDYKPGDLVTWMVGPTFPHIGVVVNKPSPADPNRLMIAHNVGAGPVIEDILFRFPMTGHYRYTPAHRKINPAMHFAKTPAPASVLRKQQKSQITYDQLLKASQYLTKAKVTPPSKKAELPAKIYLAKLDSVLPSNNLNSAAVQALLRK